MKAEFYAIILALCLLVTVFVMAAAVKHFQEKIYMIELNIESLNNEINSPKFKDDRLEKLFNARGNVATNL